MTKRDMRQCNVKLIAPLAGTFTSWIKKIYFMLVQLCAFISRTGNRESFLKALKHHTGGILLIIT